MKIIVAPDSFKGSISATGICNIVESAAKTVFENTQLEILKLPIADGGEGTVESVLEALNGEEISVLVKNPIGEEITARYGIFNQHCAVMEMAAASGLPLVPEDKKDIMKSNTYGTGQMILDAVEKGCDTIYIGIGGSATNDGGMGFASAIGVKFLDKDKNELVPNPENFCKIADIDTQNISKKVMNTKFIIMSDVKNPLLGETGATNVFGRQKGATEELVVELEKGLSHYIATVEAKLNIKVATAEGAGAAGGLGAGLLAFTDATMKSGVETVLEILNFSEKLNGTDLVVTGEGKMDFQSAYGKVAYGVGSLCKNANVPCFAIVGGLGEKSEDMFNFGISSMMTTVNAAMPLSLALENAEELCLNSAIRMFRFVKAGMEIAKGR